MGKGPPFTLLFPVRKAKHISHAHQLKPRVRRKNRLEGFNDKSAVGEIESRVLVTVSYSPKLLIDRQTGETWSITFDGWLTHVFDHSVPEGDGEAWYWHIDRDWWDENGADSIRFMTRAFEVMESV